MSKIIFTSRYMRDAPPEPKKPFIYAEDLPPRAKAVYMYLRDRADKDGRCYPVIGTTVRSPPKLFYSRI